MDDVFQLIGIMKNEYGCIGTLLWGRSMGAATAMLTYAIPGQKIPIIGMVLDAPFLN